MSINVTDFNNSRHLNNCSLLCYNNSSIHLLYSIKEFRDAVYNTLQITNSNKNIYSVVEQYDINELLYRLKYVFYLLNKKLVKQQSDTKYSINDNTLFCSRSGSKNDFYKEIYYDLIKYSTILYFNNVNYACYNEITHEFIDEINNLNYTISLDADDMCRLENNDVSRTSISYYLSIFHDISKNLFTHIKYDTYNYVLRYNDTTDINVICRKYLLIEPDIKDIAPNLKINFNNTKYLLCGLIVGGNIGGKPGGHFWTIIYDYTNNKYTEINDLDPNIDTNYNFDPNSSPVDYVLYVMEDECKYVDNYQITSQIETLSKISNKGFKSEMDCLNYKILKNVIINKIN